MFEWSWWPPARSPSFRESGDQSGKANAFGILRSHLRVDLNILVTNAQQTVL